MIVITDLLREPFDEGAKVATVSLLKKLKERHDPIIFSLNGVRMPGFVDFCYSANRLILDFNLYKTLRRYNDKLLYIPEASITAASFIRARLLQLFTNNTVIMLSMQPRTYGLLARWIIKLSSPVRVITQSATSALFLAKMGVKTKILPLGVDDDKFTPVNSKTKALLRSKYSIPSDATVLLHVGHIQESRNLDWLVKVKLQLPETQVIIVGSTSTPQDSRLYHLLLRDGITVIADYIENIDEVYNISDFYLFPVHGNNGAIETPLSVFEAMACNIPIISTPFGSLPDLFRQDSCFHFVNSIEEVIAILQKPRIEECNNRQKIRSFTWSEVARKLVEMIG